MDELEIKLEQYRIFVTELFVYEDRAQVTNRLYVTLNMATISGVLFSYANTGEVSIPLPLLLAFISCAILFCVLWWMKLRSMTRHTTAKHEVVQEMEQELPLQPFRSEWYEKLDGGKRYYRTTKLYELFPWIFIVAYLILGVTTVAIT